MKSKRDRLYQTWYDMKLRCCYSNHRQYKRYGGRGISICDRWINPERVKNHYRGSSPIGFLNFYEDMNETWFLHATIDRINNDGNYTPENCRWIQREDNISKAHKGKIVSEESRRNISVAHKGLPVWNKGKTGLNKGIVNCYDLLLGKGSQIPKDIFDQEKGVRYFGTSSKRAMSYKLLFSLLYIYYITMRNNHEIK